MSLIKKTSLLLGLVLLASCGQKVQKTEETGKRIAISDSIQADTSISNYIQPYKEHLNNTLDSTLAYNPKNLTKREDGLNTALGNLMADVVMQQANPVFKKRSGKDIDMVLLNSGGIRSDLSKGNISRRSAYALMPFENEIVVTELSGEKMKEMLQYLQQGKTAHPISGAQIKLDENYNLLEAKINGKEFDPQQTYFVATSDYLQQGGDHMDFFKDPVQLYHLDYKIRNALIDYFEKTDTIKAKADQRFVQLK
ncbi:MAG: 5'-nucleotidase [Salegentibacter sp.]